MKIVIAYNSVTLEYVVTDTNGDWICNIDMHFEITAKSHTKHELAANICEQLKTLDRIGVSNVGLYEINDMTYSVYIIFDDYNCQYVVANSSGCDWIANFDEDGTLRETFYEENDPLLKEISRKILDHYDSIELSSALQGEVKIIPNFRMTPCR